MSTPATSKISVTDDPTTDFIFPSGDHNKLLDNRTIVLYTGAMKEKRTIQIVQKSIAAFFRKNRRMPSFSEMTSLLDVRSKSVVNFWIDKLINAEIEENQ